MMARSRFWAAAVIERRYAALVRDHSRFWISGGFDLKGGLLTGVEMKLDSVRDLVSGEVSFATPDRTWARRREPGAPSSSRTGLRRNGWAGAPRSRSRRGAWARAPRSPSSRQEGT